MLSRFNCVQLFAIPWTVACQAPLSMRFYRQEYWSGFPYPPPGDHPNPWIKPLSPTLVGRFFTFELPGKPNIELYKFIYFVSVQFSSVAQSCRTLCHPMNRSMPGLPVHHQLPEFTQTHVHRVSGAIQPSHPPSSLSPPAPNPSQHQSLFQ